MQDTTDTITCCDHRRKTYVLAYALLFALAGAGYLTAGHHELFFDARQLLENTTIRSIPAAIERLWRTALRPGEELAFLTFAVNYAVNVLIGRPGLDITGFLFVNVLIHGLNACLVCRLVERLRAAGIARTVQQTKSVDITIPVLAAAIFAVHPIHSTSVAYILQRRGMMSTTFYLLGMLAFLRLRSVRGLRGRIGWACVGLMWYWMSCKSKYLGLTLPFTLLAMEFCLRASDRRALAAYAKWLVPGLGLATLGLLGFGWSLGLVDLKSFRIIPYGTVDSAVTPWMQFLTEGRVMLHYWKLLILPLPQWLCLDHDMRLSVGLGDYGAGLALLINAFILLAAIVAAARGRMFFGLGGMLFYIALIPYMFLPQSDLFVEYKAYLSTVGFVLCAVEAMLGLRRRTLMAAGVGALCLIFIGVNLRRNTIYRDPVRIWQDVVEKSPTNERGYNNLAIAYSDQGRFREAEAAYRRAVEIRPDDISCRYNLAKLLVDSGRIEEGMVEYRTILNLTPGDFPARYNLANALFKQQRFEEACSEYQIATTKRPDDFRAHLNLANTLMKLGRQGEAIEQYREVLRIKPDHAVAGRALSELEKQRPKGG